jgi:hypothetical protein
MNIARREFVTAIGLGIGGVAGCLDVDGELADILLLNKTTAEVDATIDVQRLPDETQLLRDSFTLPPGGPDNTTVDEGYEEVVDDGKARIQVLVQNGPEGSHEFHDSSSDASQVAIAILEDSIEFERRVS